MKKDKRLLNYGFISMKRKLSLSKSRSLNAGSRRKQLMKKLQRKTIMRRAEFLMQLEMCDLAKAG